MNDAPSGADKTVTTLEDTAYIFTTADFGFSDPTDAASVAGTDVLLAVKISTLPANGTLTDNGVAVTVGQFVSVADIAAGKLVFAPAANANGTGYASFTFQVQDDGGAADGGIDLDPTANAITVDVTPVNDAPVPSGPDVTLPDARAGDPYSFQLPDGQFSDVDGDTLALRIDGLPDGLHFDPATRTISGVPSSRGAGTDSFTLIATDPSGATAQRTLSLIVKSPLTTPIISYPTIPQGITPPPGGTDNGGGGGTEGATPMDTGGSGDHVDFGDNSSYAGTSPTGYIHFDNGGAGGGSYFVVVTTPVHATMTTDASGHLSYQLPAGMFRTNDANLSVDALADDGDALPRLAEIRSHERYFHGHGRSSAGRPFVQCRGARPHRGRQGADRSLHHHDQPATCRRGTATCRPAGGNRTACAARPGRARRHHHGAGGLR